MGERGEEGKRVGGSVHGELEGRQLLYESMIDKISSE